MRLLFALIATLMACLAATEPGKADDRKGVPSAPRITSVTALPMGWKVTFTPPADTGGTPIINYAVVDPNQHWLNSHAGSAHTLAHSPVFVQGYSGAGAPAAAAFQVYAQN